MSTVCPTSSCHSQQNQGACLPTWSASGDPFDCVCRPGFLLPDCHKPLDPCSPNPCVNNGICVASSNTSFTCLCPLGFSNSTCSTPPTDPKLGKPQFSPLLLPPPGSTFHCVVNQTCEFPVFSRGNTNGSPPQVNPGPGSPDVKVEVNSTQPHNLTNVPGNNWVSQVLTNSPTPGNKSVCVQMDTGAGQMAANCYVLVVDDVGTSTAAPPNSPASPKFVSPTPPDNSTLPCTDPAGCHVMVYTTPDPASHQCANMSAQQGNVHVFLTNQLTPDLCENDVIILPNDTDPTVCVQAGQGETRCFTVPPKPKPGKLVYLLFPSKSQDICYEKNQY